MEAGKTRGMVVGDVQSGKTSHYTGTNRKSHRLRVQIDNSYEWNLQQLLRAQTQHKN